MKKVIILFIVLILSPANFCLFAQGTAKEQVIDLPGSESAFTDISLNKAIKSRRSIRSFDNRPLGREKLAKILWAAQGITGKGGLRTTPSPGALYPLKLYVVSDKGFFRYLPEKHQLKFIDDQDYREKLSQACFSQPHVAGAAVDIVICADYNKVVKKYNDRGYRFAHIEAGHVGQNIHLQAVALGLGSISVGAFEDEQVQAILPIPSDYKPIYVIPIGYSKK